MLDETTGQYVTFDVTDGIRAVVASASTTTHVTPFSEIAASAAVAAGTVDTAAVNAANAMVQSNFGVDLTVKPVLDLKDSSTDTDAMGKQIAMVQKLAQVVNAAKTGQFKDPSKGTACNSVACGIMAMKAIAPTTASVVATSGTGNSMSTMNTVFNTSVTVNVPIRKSDGTISVQVIDPNNSSSIQTNLASAGLSDVVSLSSSIKAKLDQDVTNGQNTRASVVASAGADGKTAYTPPSTIAMTALDQAKTMAKFLREALNRFSNAAMTGYLDKQKTRMESEVATLVRPDTDRTISRLATVQMAIDLYDAANGSDAAKLETFTAGTKTFYTKYSGRLGWVINGLDDMIVCVAEKVTGATSVGEVSCFSAYGKYGYRGDFSPSTADFNGITSSSTTKVVGAMEVIGFISELIKEGFRRHEIHN
ncbi:MAG: hypothetical protein EBT70_16315, partial [Betaproteobacteria bacterium]|nr:hypothetical protein [Betaproteobacteria bacterium]